MLSNDEIFDDLNGFEENEVEFNGDAPNLPDVLEEDATMDDYSGDVF